MHYCTGVHICTRVCARVRLCTGACVCVCAWTKERDDPEERSWHSLCRVSLAHNLSPSHSQNPPRPRTGQGTVHEDRLSQGRGSVSSCGGEAHQCPALEGPLGSTAT